MGADDQLVQLYDDPDVARDKVGARRVLIIEDDRDIREALQELLSDLGHHVEVAASGVAGVTKFLEHRPDVALIDIGLPGIDGYEVARQIRATANGAAGYLVALTGSGGVEARGRATDAGFDQHVLKPIRASVLTEILDRPKARS